MVSHGIILMGFGVMLCQLLHLLVGVMLMLMLMLERWVKVLLGHVRPGFGTRLDNLRSKAVAKNLIESSVSSPDLRDLRDLRESHFGEIRLD